MGCLSGDVRPIVCNGHTSVVEKDSRAIFFRKFATPGEDPARRIGQAPGRLYANTSLPSAFVMHAASASE